MCLQFTIYLLKANSESKLLTHSPLNFSQNITKPLANQYSSRLSSPRTLSCSPTGLEFPSPLPLFRSLVPVEQLTLANIRDVLIFIFLLFPSLSPINQFIHKYSSQPCHPLTSLTAYHTATGCCSRDCIHRYH